MRAIDTNVLIDVLGRTTSFTPASITALDQARDRGALVICPVVAAEIAAYFESSEQLELTLRRMEIQVLDFSMDALHSAGSAFIAYRRRSSKPQDRMLADFLIGAHALCQTEGLLTRDRGYFRTYFPKLPIIEPGQA